MTYVFADYAIYSLPRGVMLVLQGDAPFPRGLDRKTAFLVWRGHASDVMAAVRAI